MKLLFCKTCYDLIRLHPTAGEWRICACGKSRARYVDGQNAEYEGLTVIPVCIDNNDFAKAIHSWIVLSGKIEKDNTVNEDEKLAVFFAVRDMRFNAFASLPGKTIKVRKKWSK